jgi:hypothetical protein
MERRSGRASRGGRIAAVAFAVLLAELPAARAQEVKVPLSGQQEIPPVTTAASGTGTVAVAADHTITGKAVVSGMKVRVAHIHDGAPGTNGPIVIPLVQESEDVWVVPPGTKLTDAQYERYRGGNFYFNVHSDAYKAGEIRGQIKP